MKQIDIISGVEVNEPNNYALNELELNFDPRQTAGKASLSINTWEIGVANRANPNDAYVRTLAHKTAGLTGGVGVTEGLPYRKLIRHAGVDTEIFDGYLNTWTARYQPLLGKITANAVERGRLSHLESGKADVSFELLYQLGYILDSMFVLVPYVISTIPNYREAFMATITIFIITDRLIQEIQNIIEMSAEAANPFEASVIARMALHALYVATLLLSLVKLLLDVFNMIIQPIKYHVGMYVNDLLRAGAAYCGLTYSSSFLEAAPLNKLLILPKKFFTKNNTGGVFPAVQGLFDQDKTGQKGFPGHGYTFAQLMEDVQKAFYAKWIATDGINLRLEKQNYTTSTPKYHITAVEREEGYVLNEEDFYSNTVLRYATDINDKNTKQEFLGTLYQVEVQQVATNDATMRLTHRLRTIEIPYALGKRKTELTFPEKIFDAFLQGAAAIMEVLVDVINVIIDVINGIINFLNKVIKALGVVGIDINFEIPTITPLDPPTFGNLIQDRIGMLKMENDFIDVPKWILVDNNSDARNNKLRPENETVLSAKYLWDNFWYFSSFVPQDPVTHPGNEKGNQWLRYSITQDKFDYTDWNLVRSDNMCIDTDGVSIGRIETCKWNIDEQSCSLDFSINETYTKNLTELKFEPNGI